MIHTASLPLPPVNRQEVLRYAAAGDASPEVTALLEDALAEALPLLSSRVCWAEFPLARRGDLLDLGFSETGSTALRQNLRHCEKLVVFAATIGLGLDRLITRYGRISPAKALLLQAIGAERIEALCDSFCEMVRREASASGLYPAPRFSPGYGDLPITLQEDIFRVLDCSRKIGLTLNESLLMSPSKSVTAIVGLHACPGEEIHRGCQSCSKTDCLYRRTTE